MHGVAVFVKGSDMLESLKNAPLPLDLFPPMAQKALQPETPKPMKMMAANGALPLPPETLILLWYQLSFERDPEITAAVAETVHSFDSVILADLATRDLPVSVLDWLSKSNSENAVLEKIILNSKTDDATIMDLAAVTTKDLVDLIAANQVRILRAPEIIDKIYANPAARMATIDKLIAFAQEHALDLSAFKALQDFMASKNSGEAESGLSDDEFEAMISKSATRAAEETQESEESLRNIQPLDATADAAENETPEQTERRLTHAQKVERMNAPQRVRLALLGDREDRAILLRDTRRIVYMSVIKSPKISIGEVAQICASKSMPDEIISYIAQRRDWIRYYPIVVALVNNPKCPLADSVGFMRQLRLNDLKNLQKSKSIPAQLARQAQMLFKQKNERR